MRAAFGRVCGDALARQEAGRFKAQVRGVFKAPLRDVRA